MKIFIKAIFFMNLFNSSAFAWERFEVVDDFSGKKSVGFLQKSSNSNGGFLIISCDKKIKFEWDLFGDYASNLFSGSDAPKAMAPRPAMPADSDRILIKTDDDSIRREKWLLDSLHETFSPKNSLKFLVQIKEKSILKIKNEALNQTGVFNISEINEMTSNLKASCN